MDSGNVFELFSQAVNEGDIIKLHEIWNYFETIDLTSAAENFAHLIMRPLNIQGETCLEVAAKKGYWTLLNRLIKQLTYHVYKCWRLSSERPPYFFPTNLMEFIGDISGKIPITEIIGNLIEIDDDDVIWMEFILDALMSSPITREVKIVALELMGAVFISWWARNPWTWSVSERHLFDVCLSKGIHCWKEALILRDATADGGPAIPNIPCVLPERLQNVFRMEEMTFEELEQYERLIHSNIDWSNGPNPLQLLQIQALLISYKILKQSNNGKTSLIYFYYKQLLDFECFMYTHFDQSRRTNIALFCMATFCRNISNVLSSRDHLWVFIRSLQLVNKCEITSANLLVAAKSTFKILAFLHSKSFNKVESLISTSGVILQIYDSMSDFFRIMNPQDQSKLKNYFSNYIGYFNLNGCLTTLLRVNAEKRPHLRPFVSMVETVTYRFSYVTSILQFLLDAGVDPNATDHKGQAPIHILAKCSVIERVPFMLKALLNAGAHIDQATPDGQTIGSILNQRRLKFYLPSFHPFESLSDNPLNVVLPLSCYCAQSIRRNGVRYQDQLPARLQKFVSIHV